MGCVMNQNVPIFNLITFTLTGYYFEHIKVIGNAWNANQMSME